jgi:hypothetical protein
MKKKLSIKIVESPRQFETVGESVRYDILKVINKDAPVGRMPQKLEEALIDSMENLQIALEQASEMSYEQGFEDGWNKAKKLLKV